MKAGSEMKKCKKQKSEKTEKNEETWKKPKEKNKNEYRIKKEAVLTGIDFLKLANTALLKNRIKSLLSTINSTRQPLINFIFVLTSK